jgi:hypothetical protein
MSANSNYANLVTFVAEKSVRKKSSIIWTTANPLFSKVFESKKFNSGFRIEGHKAITPINFAEQTTAADGVADASELTPVSPYVTSGFSQAEYEYAHYRVPMYIRNSEKKLIQGGGVRQNFMEGKTNQLVESFKKAIAEDMVSANNGSRTAVLGLRYLLATGNSPGNISQSTYPVWAAGVKTGAGPFHLGLIDNEFDRIMALGRGVADMVLLSFTSTNNVFGKMRDAIAPSQLITQPTSVAKYGFVSFRYLEMDCVMENKLGGALAGSAAVLSTDSFVAGALTDAPERVHSTPLEGTDAEELMFNWWLFYGCDDIARNSLIQDIE